MDRRVFQPQTANSGAHRRSAIGMAVAVLLAGWLALHYLQSTGPSAPATARTDGKLPPSGTVSPTPR